METVPEFVPEENPFGFFNYLKLCKGSYGFHLLSEVNTNILYHIKPMEYYEVMTFKTYICEIVFNAINLFPDITEYTINCTNENGISIMKLGRFDDLSDDGLNCMAKFICVDMDMEYLLTHNDVKQLYMNNRHENVQPDVVNTLVALMYRGGHLPLLKTSYVINKENLKNKKKEF